MKPVEIAVDLVHVVLALDFGALVSAFCAFVLFC